MMLKTRPPIFRLLLAVGACGVIAGCQSRGEIVVDEGVGITALRTACPAVGVPDHTGDVTLLRDGAASPTGMVDSRAIDVVASLTDLRSQCDDKATTPNGRARGRDRVVAGQLVHTNVSFLVQARRSDTRGARDVSLPYFITVLRGGTAVIAKRVGNVTLHFADGDARASATATGAAAVDKAEATLDRKIRAQINRKRKGGEADAAVDPLNDPDVRAAITRATFDVLVGFQLDERQLAYNATR